ncbi:MAG TPA: serine/threonine-protein kinase [Kofleriaceae bacterium]
MDVIETQLGIGQRRIPGPANVAIGRYRIERLIGGGGWGLVYAARHEILNKPVALKVLRPDLVADPAHAQRFLREARIAATLHHENIVDITDFGDEGSPYLVMELLRGRTLMSVVREQGMLPWTRVIGILVQLARALACAHAQGVVHRDLKPGNIMLDDSSGVDRIKLCDFGLSRLSSGDDRITASGYFVGTPAYMAPEQILGMVTDARGDLYALGVTGFELLTGSLPYVATNPVTLVAEIISERRAYLRDRIPKEVPDALVAVIEQCLAVDPDKRPAGAQQIEAALLAIASPAPPAFDLAGQIIGNYRITKVLGAGGSGSVWLAEHASIGTKVAVKILRPEIAFIPGAAERFVNEARAASLISSPHIARYLDIGRLPSGQLYAILEYLAGETVFERLAHDVRMPVHQVATIARQVASALVPAHAAGIVHRDLKPENVFLMSVADEDVAKVLDFGIAKMGTGSGPQTQLGYFVGTVHYCPPEQILGDAAGPAADVYALGATMFHMLVGHAPFTGDATEVASAKTVRAAPRVRIAREDVPEPLASLVDAMLARNAADRPTMAEVFERLGRRESIAPKAPVAVAVAAPAAPLAATPSTMFASFEVRRSRTGVLVLAAAAVIAALVLVVWTPWQSAARPAVAPPATPVLPPIAAPPTPTTPTSPPKTAPPAKVSPPVAHLAPPKPSAPPRPIKHVKPPPPPPSPPPAPPPVKPDVPDVMIADPYGAQ